MTTRAFQRSGRGFSTIELIVTVGIGLVLTVIAVPALYKAAQSYKVSGAARGLATQLALAKTSAANQFTQAQLNVNTTAGSYTIQVYNKSTAAFVTDSGGTQYLPAGVVFGYPNGAPPAGNQTPIAQTTPMLFNSRGMHVDSTGAPTGDDALYVTDTAGQYAYAVTVSASSKVVVYRYDFGTSTWVKP